MSGNARVLFHWMDVNKAARALDGDALAPSWVHFMPDTGQMVMGVGMTTQFGPVPRLADRRVCLVFRRDALPEGGVDLNGEAVHALTSKMMGHRATADRAAAKRLATTAKNEAARYFENPTEHFLPFDVVPSLHGLVAVGFIGSGAENQATAALRQAAAKLGVPVIEKPEALDLAAGIGRAVTEHFAGDAARKKAAAEAKRKEEAEKRRAEADAARAAAADQGRVNRRARRAVVRTPKESTDLYEEMTAERVRAFYTGEDEDLPSRRFLNLGDGASLDTLSDGCGDARVRIVEDTNEIGAILETFYGERPTSLYDLNDPDSTARRFFGMRNRSYRGMVGEAAVAAPARR